MPFYVDAHCHLTDPRIFSRASEVIAAARARDIRAFILGGVDLADWDLQLELKGRFGGVVFPCFGVHPWYVAGRMGRQGADLEREVRRALDALPGYLAKGAVGLGELGLDLGPKTDPVTLAFQEEVFVAQLAIAKEARLPLVLHVVKAHERALEILRSEGPWPLGGIVHAFAGSFETAQEYVRLGFAVSVGGAAARPGYETLKRGLGKLSLEHLVVESDSPDLAPEGYPGLEPGLVEADGARYPYNDPRSVWVVAAAIAAARREGDAESVLDASRCNLGRIFGLDFILE